MSSHVKKKRQISSHVTACRWMSHPQFTERDVPFVVETVSGLAGLSLQFEQAASEPVGIARVKPQCLVYVLGTVWLPSVSPTEILRSANSVEMTSASSGSMDRSSALISEGMSA